MIKPYTGPIGEEVDKAVANCERNGLTVVILEEHGLFTTVDGDQKQEVHRAVLVTGKTAGIQTSEVLSIMGFLQTYGRH